MKAWKNRCDRQFEDELPSKQRRRAIDQLAIGAIILLWGVLLALKQVGLIERSVSTWPFALAAFRCTARHWRHLQADQTGLGAARR